MTEIAIRCHPSVPVAPQEIADWLEQQISDLRALVPDATIRLSRLTQTLPSRDVDVGWLVELELSDHDAETVHDRLVEAIRDMGLLGFDPTLLTHVDFSRWAALGQQTRGSRPRVLAANQSLGHDF